MDYYTTSKLSKAVAYAAKKHATQVRNEGTPYIYHPLAVAEMVKNMGFGLKYQITAVLHDTLEDTDATEEELRSLFGDEVTDAVVLLTRHHGEDEEKYVDRILKNHIAAVVKNADKINNLCESTFIGRTGEIRSEDATAFAWKYLDKAVKYYRNRFSPALNYEILRTHDRLFDCRVHDRSESRCPYTTEAMTLYMDQKIDPELQKEMPDFSLPEDKILLTGPDDGDMADPVIYCLYDADCIYETCSKCWKLTHHGWVLVPDDQINRKAVFYAGNTEYSIPEVITYLRLLKNEYHYFVPGAKIGMEL